MTPPPPRLVQHLETWLGSWPPDTGRIHVVESERRTEPGWDHKVHPLLGVLTPNGGVLSTAPGTGDLLQAFVDRLEASDFAFPAFPLSLPNVGPVTTGVFRYSTAPAATPDAGEWVATSDPRVPEWLQPFNGDVLVAWDALGQYGAGVGLKMHDVCGHEISVGTEPALRGRGIGRQLVATAARRVIAAGAIPTYLHLFDNHASAKVAVGAGFPDRGWRFVSATT